MSQEKSDDGGRWYYSRKEIEENSPSRRDGIDLKKETYLRKAYCTFLQDLGMRLKVPQVTIATAIIFCHRFYLRQSHSNNDRRTVATACMFLAGKVEETPRPLKDVILVSYEINHKKDPAAKERIKQKDVYEQQKELILLAERVVLATLGFDLNVQHPYKPLVEAIKKFKVAQNALAQVAWNFVNDGLRTSLCLQFKPHHIAAGAIFLAAKFLKVKLPSDGEKVWWQEFEVTPRQLEEVSNQMLELYEQNRAHPSQAQSGEADGSTAAGAVSQTVSKASAEEHSQVGCNKKPVSLKPSVTNHVPDHEDDHGSVLRGNQNRSTDYESSGLNDQDHRENGECKVDPPFYEDDAGDGQKSRSGLSWHEDDEKERIAVGSRMRESGELKDKYHGRSMEGKESSGIQSPPDVIKIGEDKLKELREKRKKSRGEIVRRKDSLEEYDPIMKELEEGVELAAAESEKIKQEKQQSWSHHPAKLENDSIHLGKGQEIRGLDVENVEEGEVSTLDDDSWGYQSPRLNERKRKAGSPPDKTSGKQWSGSGRSYQHEYPEDRNKVGRFNYAEKDNKRHLQENHV